MPRAIRIHETGGPEAMVWESVAIPAPGPGEAHIRQTAVGLNFIDTYHRTGFYPLPLPSGLGLEGAGEVVAVGPGVTGIQPGQRVAYAGGPVGAYAEERIVPADRLVVLPEAIDDRMAAAMMLQGMTARILLRETYVVKPGDAVLIHAAAGGVGLILCQWARHLGATVIGTVGSAEKAELARANGCEHVILYREENVAERVRAVTGGEGVAVVYDGVGQATLMASLDSLRVRGLLALFGAASGPVKALDTGLLGRKGSLYLTRPVMFNYVASAEALQASAAELFEVVASGAVRIQVNQTFALKDAAEAHRALEERRTTGSTVLLP